MAQETFQSRFEAWVPQVLQMAFDYCDADPSVKRFWVVAQTQDMTNVGVVYDVNGQVLAAHELDQALTHLDCSPAAQQELLSPMTDATVAFAEAVRGAGEDMPTRVVVRYEVMDESVEADMSYGDLQPGSGGADLLPGGALFDIWVERLRSTGNDSADADATDSDWLQSSEERRAQHYANEADGVDDGDPRDPLLDEFAVEVSDVLEAAADETNIEQSWVVLQRGEDARVFHRVDGSIVDSEEIAGDDAAMPAEDLASSLVALTKMLRGALADRELNEPARLVVSHDVESGQAAWEMSDQLRSRTADEWASQLAAGGSDAADA